VTDIPSCLTEIKVKLNMQGKGEMSQEIHTPFDGPSVKWHVNLRVCDPIVRSYVFRLTQIPFQDT
jgi:hypothetical protein